MLWAAKDPIAYPAGETTFLYLLKILLTTRRSSVSLNLYFLQIFEEESQNLRCM